MKKLIITTALLLATVTSALASCPVAMPYRCVPAGNKMMCGCGM